MEYEIIKQIPDKKKAGRKSIYKEIILKAAEGNMIKVTHPVTRKTSQYTCIKKVINTMGLKFKVGVSIRYGEVYVYPIDVGD